MDRMRTRPTKQKTQTVAVQLFGFLTDTCGRYDNDLKDHHAPMKGEALPKRQVRERRIRQQSRLLLDKHNFLMIRE